MSFDVFFQRFANGDGESGGNAEAREVLEPYLVRDSSGAITGLRVVDGSAQLFGLDGPDGFMANHIEGRGSWDLLVRAARAGRFAIMPVGCPVCVPAAELAAHLPPELVADANPVLVANGDDLTAAVRDA